MNQAGGRSLLGKSPTPTPSLVRLRWGFITHNIPPDLTPLDSAVRMPPLRCEVIP